MVIFHAMAMLNNQMVFLPYGASAESPGGRRLAALVQSRRLGLA